MKHLKHPATFIATLALFVGLAGGAYAGGLINGSHIKNHSIASKKLNNAAVKQFTAPAGQILTYDANAVGGSPTPTPFGTVLGDTYAATCTTTGTNAVLVVYIKTTDRSWNVDYSYITDEDGTINQDARKFNLPAGSLPNSFQSIDLRSATTSSGQGDLDFVQLNPVPGQLIWHETALAGATPSCHLLVQGIPEPVTATHASPHAPANGTVHLPLNLTH